ncbi:hypothetical protein ACIQU6_41395 [Streptomyces sp. NPDC090442]|uniref:hypothetical protein n=1 Tax=Streptomyces sp. NPDC090442 TaxID=3365962 RepID=UPI0038137E2C
MTTKRIAALRETAEDYETKAKKAKTALLNAAIKEAMTSVAYGHLSAVAREAGIASQYLRTLIEDQHPGWLAQAAEEREAAKAARKGPSAKATRTKRASSKAAA